MSIAAEIVMQRLARRLTGRGEAIALASRLGLASPGVESVANVVRLALNPVGGMRRRPAAMFAPPIDLVGAPDEAARLLEACAIFADFTQETVEEGLDSLRRLAGRTPEVVRLRGAVAEVSGMRQLFSDNESSEVVFVNDSVRVDQICDGLDPFEPGFVDEFSVLSINEARGVFKGLNFTAAGADLSLDPLSALDLPDAGQIDAAVGEGVVRPDCHGACSLAVPSMGAASTGFRIELSLPGFKGQPVISASGAADLSIVEPESGNVWCISGIFDAASEAALVDFLAPSCGADSAVSKVVLEIVRRRGEWEAWDEADAQLALEESW